VNAIVVLNLNDYLPPIARQHFMDAAQRWSVQYVEITKPLADNLHLFWQKARIAVSEYATHYARVLQLDGDMLVMPHCPSPFDATPAGAFGAVSRIQPHRHFRVPTQRWASRLGVTPYRDEAHHLNAGLLLYQPKEHAEVLAEWQQYASATYQPRICQMPEQFVLSCLLDNHNVPVHWLPWQFNALRVGRDGPVPHEAYIAHLHSPRSTPLQRQMRQHLRHWDVG
jgi:hypothetical protein